MYLNKPAFSIAFSVEDTVGLIESMIKSKHWTDFEVAEVKLVYIPFWIFNYDAYVEGPTEGQEAAAVSDHVSGKMALNAYTNELDENVHFLYESADVKLEQKPTKDYPFEIQRPKVREREAREIAAVRIAAKISVPKENVIISGLEMVYLPMWFAWVTVAEGTYKLQINAVGGEILNEEQVPERERGWLEVTSETLEELKQPGAWVEYTSEIGRGIFSFITQNPLVLSAIEKLKADRRLQIIVLIIILIIVILFF